MEKIILERNELLKSVEIITTVPGLTFTYRSFYFPLKEIVDITGLNRMMSENFSVKRREFEWVSLEKLLGYRSIPEDRFDIERIIPRISRVPNFFEFVQELDDELRRSYVYS